MIVVEPVTGFGRIWRIAARAGTENLFSPLLSGLGPPESGSGVCWALTILYCVTWFRSFRRKIVQSGLKEAESPMPTFRPDLFADKTSPNGNLIEQVAVEAEIPSTLFSEHTAHQLLKMDDFIRHQKSRRIRVRGFLLVPKGKEVQVHAKALLWSLFPEGTSIRIVDAA